MINKLILYVLLLINFGCSKTATPNFKIGDNVVVTSGFYVGCNGIIMEYNYNEDYKLIDVFCKNKLISINFLYIQGKYIELKKEKECIN